MKFISTDFSVFRIDSYFQGPSAKSLDIFQMFLMMKNPLSLHVFIVDFLLDFEGSKLQFVDILSLPRPFLLDFAPLFDSVLTARNNSSANTK